MRLRSALVLAASAHLAAMPAYAQTVEVTSPNGGETWEAATQHEISWTTTGSLQPNVFIDLTLNGFIWNTINASTPNDGNYLWTVPTTQSTTCKVRVRVYPTAGGNIADASDANFTIFSAIVILTSPNGGEVWQAGTLETVTWTSAGALGPNVDLEYSINNGSSWTSIVAGTPDDGSYSWLVPNVSSSSSWVRITGYPTAGGTWTDAGDGLFQIVNASLDFTIAAPNGEETREALTDQMITWSHVGSFEPEVWIEYTTDGSDWNTIVFGTPNDGSHVWSVPNEPSTTCRVRVTGTPTGGGDAGDASDADFTILQPFGDVTLVLPNGGEVLWGGTPYDIQWSTEGYVEQYVSLRYTTGGAWQSISVLTDNDGHHSWSPPNLASSTCLVQVVASLSPSGTVSDTSDAFFTIDPVSVTVLDPNGSEGLTGGVPYAILWSTDGPVQQYASLQYTTGGAWQSISVLTDNDGTYTWNPPNVASSTCRVSVTVPLIGFGSVSDTSDADFTIDPVTVTVTAPNGGERLEGGVPYAIQWSTDGPVQQYVSLRYTTGGGWQSISVLTDNDGTYAWNPPNAASSTCRVSVTASLIGFGSVSDTSDADFTIDPVTVTLSAPNGGESWEAGTEQEIAWTTDGSARPDVDLWYTTGSGWSLINITPNDGSHLWVVPNAPSQTCRVRIMAYLISGGPVADTSDAVFTIGGALGAEPPAPKVPIFALEPPRPNPVPGRVVLRFSLDAPRAVQVRLVDVAGRTAAVRDLGTLETGAHELGFLDDASLPPGVYFVILDADGRRRTHKIVLVR